MASETLLNERYRLVAQQGSGGMAVIYRGIDEALGRTVAVKILRPSLTADPAFITRFQNEARSIANLSHPNIVTVHDVGSDGPTHYIVMELVEGQDLKKVIRAHGALPVDKALNYAIGICAGIGFAHRAGIVHADIKPQNILLTRDDMVKITDFGIAQALSDTQPFQRQSVVWGSPHYFAPEQAQGEKPTPGSDVYAIGIVLFEMLAGRLPYTGSNQQELAMAHIREPIPRVTDFNPRVPEALSNIVYKVMSKEASGRYRMADQLGHVLISYRNHGTDRTAVGTPADDRPAAPAPESMPTQPNQAAEHGQQNQQSPPRQHDSKPIPPAPPGRSSQVSQPPRQGPGTPPPAPAQQQGSALPTQRYGVAPNAPSNPGYGQQQQQQPRPTIPKPSDSRPFVTQRYSAGQAQQGARSDSRPYVPQQSYAPARREEDPQFTLDGVTIVLAVIAFMAVACLIPLYIAVLQAHLG